MALKMFGQSEIMSEALHALKEFGSRWDYDHPHDRANQLKRDAAEFLWAFVYATQPRNILEIGCGTGYATLWMASAIVGTSGKVFAVDEDSRKIEIARKWVAVAGLEGRVNFVRARVDEVWIEQNLAEDIDFVFLDCAKASYGPIFRALVKSTQRPLAFAADNVISKKEAMLDFLGEILHLEQQGRIRTALVPAGSGLCVGQFTGDAAAPNGSERG